ncbi:hypothetical protein NDU88_002245 [Pleurodeles waltl]|uniref:Uncharacterized protein n=1 Tax=Pleurodeles waltl TaxID=8319 RepID=A0AAV7KV28_PLEWA|nr:hypothetical protein NDU88_002245 [Pleurodeles waltl]
MGQHSEQSQAFDLLCVGSTREQTTDRFKQVQNNTCKKENRWPPAGVRRVTEEDDKRIQLRCSCVEFQCLVPGLDVAGLTILASGTFVYKMGPEPCKEEQP